MKVITLLNEKGGVGKTTLATHIAAGLALLCGQRVVIMDADGQGHVAELMGLKSSPGFYNVLGRDAEWKDELRSIPPSVYLDSAFEAMNQGELYMLPGNEETALIPYKNPNVYLLRERLKELEGWADIVVFDTSPAPSVIHASIWMASDFVLIPVEPSRLSLSGLAKSIAHQEGASRMRRDDGLGEVERLGIVPTMFRSQTTAHDISVQHLVSTYKRLVWPPIPLRTVFEQASLAGELLYKYAPQDEVTTDILAALVERVAKGVRIHVG